MKKTRSKFISASATNKNIEQTDDELVNYLGSKGEDVAARRIQKLIDANNDPTSASKDSDSFKLYQVNKKISITLNKIQRDQINEQNNTIVHGVPPVKTSSTGLRNSNADPNDSSTSGGMSIFDAVGDFLSDMIPGALAWFRSKKTPTPTPTSKNKGKKTPSRRTIRKPKLSLKMMTRALSKLSRPALNVARLVMMTPVGRAAVTGAVVGSIINTVLTDNNGDGVIGNYFNNNDLIESEKKQKANESNVARNHGFDTYKSMVESNHNLKLGQVSRPVEPVKLSPPYASASNRAQPNSPSLVRNEYQAYKIFKFHNTTPSKLNKINPNMLHNLESMGSEYTELYGSKMQINSSFRTVQEQAVLRRKVGTKAALPGKSMHNYGLAVDMETKDAQRAEDAGLFTKYGFHRPVRKETWHVEPNNIDRQAVRESPINAAVEKTTPRNHRLSDVDLSPVTEPTHEVVKSDSPSVDKSHRDKVVQDRSDNLTNTGSHSLTKTQHQPNQMQNQQNTNATVHAQNFNISTSQQDDVRPLSIF